MPRCWVVRMVGDVLQVDTGQKLDYFIKGVSAGSRFDIKEIMGGEEIVDVTVLLLKDMGARCGNSNRGFKEVFLLGGARAAGGGLQMDDAAILRTMIVLAQSRSVQSGPSSAVNVAG